MKALVTGASGFIGQNLVSSLVEGGWEVIVLSRRTNHPFVGNKKIQIVYGDLTIPKSLAKIKQKIKKVDVVFNLAGAVPRRHLSEKAYWQTNVDGVKNLLEIYKQSNIKRFVHVSTVGIYGTTGSKIVDEKYPFHLPDIYSKTKAAGENLAFRYYKKAALPVVVIRPTVVFGPNDIGSGFSKLFPLIKKGMYFPIGKGDNFFHIVYVGNLINALILASKEKRAVGEDFIIGDDPCPTMGKIIKTIAYAEGVNLPSFYLPKPLALIIGKFFDIAQRVGLPAPLNTQRVESMTENKRFSLSKAKKILGYKPAYNLQQGIKETFQWYQKKGML